MKILYDTAWRVWHIATMKQWIVHPPDGYYRRGEFVYLTNVTPLYYKKQKEAWKLARKNARKMRTQAILNNKAGTKHRIVRDYRPKHETLQTS